MSEEGRDIEVEIEDTSETRAEQKSESKRWRRSLSGSITWGAVLIWVGVVLLISSLELTDGLRLWNTWAIAFAGAGVIVLLSVMFRLLAPSHRQPVIGGVILGLILLGVGVGWLVGWNLVWPVALIAIGLVLLLRVVTRRR